MFTPWHRGFYQNPPPGTGADFLGRRRGEGRARCPWGHPVPPPWMEWTEAFLTVSEQRGMNPPSKEGWPPREAVRTDGPGTACRPKAPRSEGRPPLPAGCCMSRAGVLGSCEPGCLGSSSHPKSRRMPDSLHSEFFKLQPEEPLGNRFLGAGGGQAPACGGVLGGLRVPGVGVGALWGTEGQGHSGAAPGLPDTRPGKRWAEPVPRGGPPPGLSQSPPPPSRADTAARSPRGRGGRGLARGPPGGPWLSTSGPCHRPAGARKQPRTQESTRPQ